MTIYGQPGIHPIIDLDNLFSYHAPRGDQADRYAQLRDKAKEFAALVLYLCPPSADTTAAIRHIREAVMTANASIACGESCSFGPQGEVA